MKRSLLLSLSVLFFISATAVAKNREVRNVATFNGMEFLVPAKIVLQQGSPQTVELVGNADVLQDIESEVRNGVLTIGRKGKSAWFIRTPSNVEPIEVLVTVENIKTVTVSSAASLIAPNPLSGHNVNLSVKGSGSIQVELVASGDVNANISGSGMIDLKGTFKNLRGQIDGSGNLLLTGAAAEQANFGISGAGTITAAGTANQVTATVVGSGEIMAAKMEASKSTVRISGAGGVQLNAKVELDVNISGAGNVSYTGNPTHVKSQSSGSGSIKTLNL